MKYSFLENIKFVLLNFVPLSLASVIIAFIHVYMI